MNVRQGLVGIDTEHTPSYQEEDNRGAVTPNKSDRKIVFSYRYVEGYWSWKRRKGPEGQPMSFTPWPYLFQIQSSYPSGQPNINIVQATCAIVSNK